MEEMDKIDWENFRAHPSNTINKIQFECFVRFTRSITNIVYINLARAVRKQLKLGSLN